MPQYRSKERVYDLDEHGEPWRLRHAVGDVIDEAEARRQGLIADDTAADAPEQPEPAEGKRIPGPPADKARRSSGSKTTVHPPKG
jgi:hypothetical protein